MSNDIGKNVTGKQIKLGRDILQFPAEKWGTNLCVCGERVHLYGYYTKLSANQSGNPSETIMLSSKIF